MIKAVLLDLDNTLISNPDRPFAFAFLQALQGALEPHFGNVDTAALFREALAQLSTERTGDETNTGMIVRHLSENSQLPSTVAQEALENFYAQVYPQLEENVQPVPKAHDLVLKLHKMGYILVIATNPIYPAEAVRHRMAWGNLPLDESLYALITSADNMHFSKPSPMYYAEILGRIGVEPDEALMFGDRLSSDIEPANLVGLQTLHHKSGELDQFLTTLNEMQQVARPNTLEPEGVMAQLRGNIGALYGLLEQVETGFWHQRPIPTEWSLLQILCHLTEVEASDHRQRLKRIWGEENPFLIASDPPGPDIPNCAAEGFSVAKSFVQERETTLRFLRSLPEQAWKRPARHSVFGLTTFIEMAYFTAQHDRLHLNQFCQTIGRCS